MTPQATLLAYAQPLVRTMAKSFHVDIDRVVRLARKLVATKANWKIEHCVDVITGRSKYATDTEFFPRPPVIKRDVSIENWRLHLLCKRVKLPSRKFRAQRWNNSVITSQHSVSSSHLKRSAIFYIRYRNSFCRTRFTVVFNARHRAIEAQSDGRVRNVKLSIVEWCVDDIFHRRTRSNVRNHRAHQHSSN